RRLDLALVPSGVVGRLNLVRGPSSLIWGPNTTGGVLDLVPRALGSDGQLMEADISTGLPLRGRAGATYLRRSGPWSSAVSVDAQANEGAALANSLPFSQPDPSVRTNSDRRAVSALGRIHRRLRSGATVAATLLHLQAAQGVAPEGHLDPAVSRVRFWRIPDWRHTTLVMRATAPLSRFGVDATVWAGTFGQTVHAFSDATYEQRAGGQRDGDETVGARAVLETVGPAGTLRGILWGLASAHRQLELADGATTERFRETEGRVAIEAETQVGAATALLGMSLDGFRPLEAGPRAVGDGFRLVGLVARAEAPVSGMRVHAGLSRGGRFPTMRELFGQALGRFALNPELGPEVTWQAEVGARSEGARASGWAALFARRTTGTIEQEVLEDGRRQRVNLGSSRALGAEGGVAVRVGSSLRIDASATLMQLRGRNGDGAEVPLAERPERLARFAVTTSPPDGWMWAAEVLAVGPAVSLVQDGTTTLPTSARLGARLGHRWVVGRGLVDAFVHLDNATNTVHLPQAGLPAPGREVRFGLRWTR
ncbi:MAG: TonB-dependent receptor, partial [Bacteroidota bacterium]